MIDDVLIVGAGPAGSVAAAVLARAGARVRLLDRATFPRDKLCGDTVNPGTLAVLRRLGLSKPIDDHGLRVDGMRVTGPRGVAVEGRYPDGLHGRALVRSDMDWALLQLAIDAGARFEPSAPVRRAIVEESEGSRSVRGAEPFSEAECCCTSGSGKARRSTFPFGSRGKASTTAT